MRSLRNCFRLALAVCPLSAVGFDSFSNWRRISDEPIIAPRGNSWESAGTHNPAAVVEDDKFIMLYRAQDGNGTSRQGYAESADGFHFTRRHEPVFIPEADYEKDGGVEDPRLVKFGGQVPTLSLARDWRRKTVTISFIMVEPTNTSGLAEADPSVSATSLDP